MNRWQGPSADPQGDALEANQPEAAENNDLHHHGDAVSTQQPGHPSLQGMLLAGGPAFPMTPLLFISDCNAGCHQRSCSLKRHAIQSCMSFVFFQTLPCACPSICSTHQACCPCKLGFALLQAYSIKVFSQERDRRLLNAACCSSGTCGVTI